MTEKLRIAIDFSQLDSISPASGQYRYGVDLVRGLAQLQPDVDFLLLGSRVEPVAELRPVFKQEGSRWHYRQLPHRQFRGAGYLNHARYSWMLLRERISLLHSLHTFVPILAPCPVVITMYDLMYELFRDYDIARRSRPYRMHKWAVKHSVRRIICISETTATDLRQLWDVENDRIDVVPLGSAPWQTAVAGGVQSGLKELTDSTLVVVSPYNLEPRKNLAPLLEATASLISDFPNLKLVLFGHAAVSPEREENFERKIRELGIEHCVIRTGILADHDLGALYSRATLFVFPSLYEGFGLPLLEAMFRGTCVVARNASAMAEVVGDCGLLVDTRDAQALAAAVAALLNNENLRSALGQRARERARSFSVEEMAINTYRSYLTALDQEVGVPMPMNTWPAS